MLVAGGAEEDCGLWAARVQRFTMIVKEGSKLFEYTFDKNIQVTRPIGMVEDTRAYIC